MASPEDPMNDQPPKLERDAAGEPITPDTKGRPSDDRMATEAELAREVPEATKPGPGPEPRKPGTP